MNGHRVTETKLYKLLRQRERKDGFEAAEISSTVAQVIGYAWPILQQVVRNFPLYTLHDPDHSFRVAEHMAALIPRRTVSLLNSLEISVLLYSAYLHDVGMAASQDEFARWIGSLEYRNFIDTRFEWADTIHRLEHLLERRAGSDAQPEGYSTEIANALRAAQDAAFTEYLRENHATRSASFITDHFGNKANSVARIIVGQVNYAAQVALVCESHALDARHLKEERFRRDLYLSRFPVNLQYCCLILRLADLIDLDPERTPQSLLEFLALDLKYRALDGDLLMSQRNRSAAEWQKHRAVIGWKITPSEIRIEASCSHPAVHHGLLQWSGYIEEERRECRQLVIDNRQEITAKYQLDLDADVRSDHIRSDGSYIYSDFRFSLDYDHIVDLLMGKELWGDPAFAVRELLQNAIDSCHHRAAIADALGVSYSPRITFEATRADAEPDSVGQMVLACSDNGMGMDQEIVENYLMRVGRSYYRSSEFRRQNLEFWPISRFGLGVMSYFMLADRVEIYTRRRDAQLHAKRALQVTFEAPGRYVVLRPLEAEQEGTRFELFANEGSNRKRRDHSRSPIGRRGLLELLRRLAVHVDVPIEVASGGAVDIVAASTFSLSELSLSQLPFIQDRVAKFRFSFDYAETGGLKGEFRFLIPLKDCGSPCLTCVADEVFIYTIDSDGDLVLATANYSARASVHLGIPDDWDTDELRGVYRAKYGKKPVSEKWSDELDSDILELVQHDFRWSQDGLAVVRRLVGDGEFDHFGMARDLELEPADGGNAKGLLTPFSLVRVPGLQAADIDLRGPWRLPLNVQRTQVVDGPETADFVDRYAELAAKMWREILERVLDEAGKEARLALEGELQVHATSRLLRKLELRDDLRSQFVDH